MRRAQRDTGFTLIELMIVVAIIGLISTIAIPQFLSYQARSRRSEAFSNVGALARVEKAFQAEKGDFYEQAVPYPDWTMYGGLGESKMPWDSDSQMAFSPVGWEPEGEVFYGYDVNTGSAAACTCTLCFTATAYGDVDGDGMASAVMYVEPQVDGSGAVTGSCLSGFGFGTPLNPHTGQPMYSQPAVYRQADEY